MTGRLDHELHTILGDLQIEIETPPVPTVYCCYHQADASLWKLLDQHLEAIYWQYYRQFHQKPLFHKHEYDPQQPEEADRIAQSMQDAHIVVIALSIDMQLALQRSPTLYNLLVAKVEQARQRQERSEYQQAPVFVLGVLLRAIPYCWNENPFCGMNILPCYREALASQHDKQKACAQIAETVFTYAEAVTRFFHRSQQ